VKNIMITMFPMILLVLVGCSASEPTPTDIPASPTNTPPLPTNTPPPPTITPTDTPIPEVVGIAERGREIFENGGAHENYIPEAFCTRCHTLDGSDEKEHLGPQLRGISERAGERVPGLSAAQYIHQSILDPRAYVVEGYSYMYQRPGQLLSEEEVADLVAFLLTQ
jgi:cytochrome c1